MIEHVTWSNQAQQGFQSHSNQLSGRMIHDASSSEEVAHLHMERLTADVCSSCCASGDVGFLSTNTTTAQNKCDNDGDLHGFKRPHTWRLMMCNEGGPRA